MRNCFRIAVALIVSLAVIPVAQAQYFGRNKVQWEHFHFKLIQTQHFDIYYYDQEADVVNDIGRQAERWYGRLSRVFQHSFTRKPIVLYANAADFQQTTTTGEMIGQGTGGFTDEYMNRVVLPLTGDYAENDHVLGHELVHVFQYDIANAQNNAKRRFNLEAMPLWLVEGMAEYFSKGRVDPLTAMWVRDATIHNRLPDLRQLTSDPRYFPYRYGQALLAYIGGRFGDEMVVRYFLAAGLVGIEPAFERTVGLSPKQLFNDWQESARELYSPTIATRPSVLGRPIIGRKASRGDLNVGPTISPDGKYIAFLSTRELFDIDLFLADAKTGAVIRRLVSTDRNAHFDALRFIDSAGSWSPDSQRLAFVVFEKGDNYLGIVDVGSRKVKNIRVPGVDSISNVAWAPVGNRIAISGQRTGVTDLFIYDLDTNQVRQLTADKYADLQPAWSPDGKQIAFVSDRGASTNLEQLRFNSMQISVINVDTAAIRTLPLFANAKNITPFYSPDGNSLYFVANPEGVDDIYRYAFADGRIERITAVQTGVAGITEMSPALSVASRTGDIAFSVYEDDNYNIYTLPSTAPGTLVAANNSTEAPRAGVLPPLRATGSEITAFLNNPTEGLLPTTTTFPEKNYRPNLHVAYVGPPTVGVGVSNYGVGVGGSVSAWWSDILGQHNVGLTVAGSGTGVGSVLDQIGGEVIYLNQQHRFNWGADVTHIPYVAQAQGYQQIPVDIGNGQVVLADQYQQLTEIQTVDNVSALAQYPFSQTRRVEVQGGIEKYSDKLILDTVTAVGGSIIDETREHIPGSFNMSLLRASTAFVGDSSVFGFVSPVRGTRYRYELGWYTGDIKFTSALADWRKYWFLRPVTLAVKGLHYGRYGAGSEDPRLGPIDLGYNWIVRGYDGLNYNECTPTVSSTCPQYDRLVGSRVLAGSFEVRAPLLGTKEYGLINAPAVPTEFEGFFDIGTAYNSVDKPVWRWATNTTERVPVASVGVGLRILLSYIPIEVYAAKPFQRPGKGVVYGFNLIPGW